MPILMTAAKRIMQPMRQQQRCQCNKIDDANAEKDQDNGAANHKSKDSEAEMSIIMRAEMAKVMTTQKAAMTQAIRNTLRKTTPAPPATQATLTKQRQRRTRTNENRTAGTASNKLQQTSNHKHLIMLRVYKPEYYTLRASAGKSHAQPSTQIISAGGPICCPANWLLIEMMMGNKNSMRWRLEEIISAG